MNANESQTPEPVVESLVEPKEPNPTVESVQDSSVESLLDEPRSTDEPLEDSAIDFLVELEEEISQIEPLENPEEDNREVATAQRVADLQRQEIALKQEIATLQASLMVLSEQLTQTQTTMGKVVQEALVQLEQRKQALQIAVEQLERRQERIRTEMRTSFAGTSQELAIRVQGFKDYLTGSLQDLAASAEQLELVPKIKEVKEDLNAKKQALYWKIRKGLFHAG